MATTPGLAAPVHARARLAAAAGVLHPGLRVHQPHHAAAEGAGPLALQRHHALAAAADDGAARRARQRARRDGVQARRQRRRSCGPGCSGSRSRSRCSRVAPDQAGLHGLDGGVRRRRSAPWTPPPTCRRSRSSTSTTGRSCRRSTAPGPSAGSSARPSRWPWATCRSSATGGGRRPAAGGRVRAVPAPRRAVGDRRARRCTCRGGRSCWSGWRWCSSTWSTPRRSPGDRSTSTRSFPTPSAPGRAGGVPLPAGQRHRPARRATRSSRGTARCGCCGSAPSSPSAGLAVTVFAPTWPVAVLGFLSSGGGVAVVAPLSFSAAARIAGERRARPGRCGTRGSTP